MPKPSKMQVKGLAEQLAVDIQQSREFEMKTYLKSMNALYANALIQNGEVYDIAFNLTGGFSNITKEAILSDSRIIKVLRYAIAPSISQMKFGQFFRQNSTGDYEQDKVVSGTSLFSNLTLFASELAEFISKRIDKSRFIWLDKPSQKSDLAFEYAKKWTCSIAADQNAQTAYRNWRKQQQELAVVNNLVSLGYVQSTFGGTITSGTDIKLGEFTKERKVKGLTLQKADLAVRSKSNKKLVLIEAKAVGVELDATKRIKECCDKAHDWGNPGAKLAAPIIVAVIAGFFTATNISNLQASGINVVWEHRLDDLKVLL